MQLRLVRNVIKTLEHLTVRPYAVQVMIGFDYDEFMLRYRVASDKHGYGSMVVFDRLSFYSAKPATEWAFRERVRATAMQGFKKGNVCLDCSPRNEHSAILRLIPSIQELTAKLAVEALLAGLEYHY